MTTIKSYFSQVDNISDVISQEIVRAQKYVLLAMYTISDQNLIEALIKLNSEGKNVFMICDQRQMHNNQNVFFTINNAGIMFRTVEGKNASMHHKFIVIDDRITITGSFNWTYSAQNKNFENIVLIEDPKTAHRYKEEFDRIWKPITLESIEIYFHNESSSEKQSSNRIATNSKMDSRSTISTPKERGRDVNKQICIRQEEESKKPCKEKQEKKSDREKINDKSYRKKLFVETCEHFQANKKNKLCPDCQAVVDMKSNSNIGTCSKCGLQWNMNLL